MSTSLPLEATPGAEDRESARLHGYFRSSASFRVRIALNLKGISIEHVTYRLRLDEHRASSYSRMNPQGLVPALELDGLLLTQSLAIIEYLDETRPGPALLPRDPWGRARVRSLAQLVACDIHPLDNLRVLNYLRRTLRQPEDSVRDWYNHWIATGFAAMEARACAESETGRFLHGDTPTLADIALVPQMVNAAVFALDLSAYPALRRIYDEAMSWPAFAAALPANQPDARRDP